MDYPHCCSTRPLYGVPIDYPSLAHTMGLNPLFIQDFLEAHATET